jgi:DNA-directed RNA polymerase subunit RPC12/RpoP
MNHIPSIDYMCSHCGTRQLYQLVPAGEPRTEEQITGAPHETPSLDFRCSKCGAVETYMLVPAGTAA